MRWALITGASHGIGRELARLAAVDFSGLLLVGRDPLALAAVAGEVSRPGLTVRVLAVDLSVPEGVAAVVEAAAEWGTAPDWLVNNAGIGAWGFSRDLPPDTETRLLDLNVRALTSLCGAFQAPMVARGSGVILNVASTAAFQAGPRMAAYYASKAFVLHYSEALAAELAGCGVTVTCLCPGPTESRFHERAGTRRSRLVVGGLLPMADAASVARAGYDGAVKGRCLVIPGLVNRLAVLMVRLAPRRLATAIAGFIGGPQTGRDD